MEHARVERLQLVLRRALNLNPIQLLRPRLPRPIRRALELCPVRYLLIQVRPRLLDRDERHAHTHVHRPRPLLEPHEPRQQPPLPTRRPLANSTVLDRPVARKVLVEARDEVRAPDGRRAIRVDDEVLALGVRPRDLARGRVDRERAVRVREHLRVEERGDLRARRLEEDVRRLGVIEREAQVADARRCAKSAQFAVGPT